MEETESKDSGMGSLITAVVVIEAIKQFRSAPGVDEICPQFFKALDVLGLPWLTCLWNIAGTSGTMPLEWQTAVMGPPF